jgi:hypothetical protein
MNNKTTVSTFRLYLLRAGYLLLVVGLGLQIWPDFINNRVAGMELMEGAVTCMLLALSLLAWLGLRYPLRMLPLLFWEMAWKAAWLLVVALPHWSAGNMDDGTAATAFACLIGLVFPFLIPWSYVFENYVKRPGDPWRGRAIQSTPAAVHAPVGDR